ncbi:MAG TPA: rRNA maturation RNase YbeY [Candidatus Binatia bacterium]|nr:rRNA maturation RNase YbeY [Candidatus Binatia bacterium]
MISNCQRAVRVPIRSMQQFFARAMKEVRLPQTAASVCFVTDAQIAKWNAAYRGKNKPTDVLSFPIDDGARRKKGNVRAAMHDSQGLKHSSFASLTSYLGDIAIAPAVARRNARLYGRTLDQELRILILHGILHLMGYDHETDTGQMDRREKRLRRSLRIA